MVNPDESNFNYQKDEVNFRDIFHIATEETQLEREWER